MTPQDTTRLTSFLLRVLWAGWMIGRGRPYTPEEVKQNKGAMLAMAKNFLPELIRMKGKTK